MGALKIVGIFGVIVLLISLPVHFLTYLGINLAEKNPVVWVLFGSGMLIFILSIVVMRITLGGEEFEIGKIFGSMPIASRVTLGLFFAYMIIGAAISGPGFPVPTEENGQYVVRYRGGAVAYYTAEETERRRLLQMRSLSAFWMWLTLFPTLYILPTKNELPEEL